MLFRQNNNMNFKIFQKMIVHNAQIFMQTITFQFKNSKWQNVKNIFPYIYKNARRTYRHIAHTESLRAPDPRLKGTARINAESEK